MRLDTEQLLNLHGKEYVRRFTSKRSHRVRIKRLSKYIELKGTETVLDVGCGNGLLLGHIHGHVSKYYGIDFSKDFIDVAKNRHFDKLCNDIQFVCGDVITFCEKSKLKFDTAFAFDFVEHIYDDDLIEILSSVFRSLKPKGELYIHTPNAEYIVEILKEKGIIKQFPEHIAVRDIEEYNNLFKKVGFRKVEVVYLSHYVRLLSALDFLRYLPLIGKYFRARLFIKCIKL